MKAVPFRKFEEREHRTWRTLFKRQTELRDQQIVPMFAQGLKALGITEEGIPEIETVNAKLRALTGWEGVPVEGLEEGESFYTMLADRKFPVGNFIRDEKDLSYTPAPDVFHDLYGHLPFFTNPQYAAFCEEFGHRASSYVNDPVVLRQFERLFWFTLEFGLIKTPYGNRIFGAGIASSHGECAYALSDKPNVQLFDLETVRAHEFRIDIFQEDLFLLENEQQLYSCLEQFEEAYA